jgi:hypothetical protein
MRRIRVSQRRIVAATALLLASSLEICGCNLAQDCDRIRNLALSEANWPLLMRHCGECLSSEEMNKLSQARTRLTASAVAAPLHGGETVEQELLGEDRLTFYAPHSASHESVDDVRSSASTPNLALPPARWSRPWPISESVFFVYSEIGTGRGPGRDRPAAAAFVLSVPSLDHRSRVRFLVTARHVVDPEWAHCPGKNPTSIGIRLNRWSGGAGYERILLEVNHIRQFSTPVDETADIAVIRLDERVVQDIESYKFMDTPFRLLPTESELVSITRDGQIDDAHPVSRPIVTASMNAQAFSEEAIYPVSDTGMLTSTANEPVEIQCDPQSDPALLRIWTIAASGSGEVIGAPVYTTMLRGAGKIETPVLVGVQSIARPGRNAAGIAPADALSQLIQEVLRRSGQPMDFSRGPLP